MLPPTEGQIRYTLPPNEMILLDVQSQIVNQPPSWIPPSSESLSETENRDSQSVPQESHEYQGIWISNPLMGKLFFPKSPLGDFGEYYVAVATAESWAKYLKSLYHIDIEDPNEMIIQTPRLGSLIAMIQAFALHNPVAMKDRTEHIRKN